MNSDGFGCGTRIGFCSASGLGYCKKCDKVFRYYYNLYNGLMKGEGNCPDCGAGEVYNEVVRSSGLGIDVSIRLEEMLSESSLISEAKRETCRKEVNELKRIKELFKDFEEEENVRNKEG